MAFRSDLDALILGVLQTAELHGYEISNRIERISEESLAVGDGLLYPALRRLEGEGLIESRWEPQAGRPDRRVYRITAEGLSALTSKRNEWVKFSEGVARILSGESHRVEAARA